MSKSVGADGDPPGILGGIPPVSRADISKTTPSGCAVPPPRRGIRGDLVQLMFYFSIIRSESLALLKNRPHCDAIPHRICVISFTPLVKGGMSARLTGGILSLLTIRPYPRNAIVAKKNSNFRKKTLAFSGKL